MSYSLEAMRARLRVVQDSASSGLPAAEELCVACVGLFEVDGAAISIVFDGASRGTFGSSSEASRRLDEYQFTFGEGPCLDAAATSRPVLVPDLGTASEQRWPAFADAVLGDGIRSVFALPIMITSVCVGALDLFRERPGPLGDDELAGARLAALLAAVTLGEILDAGETRMPGSAARLEEHLAEVDRVEVHQATGMLIAQLGVDADEALVRLRAHAIATDQTASQVARGIVERRILLERDDPGGRLDTDRRRS